MVTVAFGTVVGVVEAARPVPGQFRFASDLGDPRRVSDAAAETDPDLDSQERSDQIRKLKREIIYLRARSSASTDATSDERDTLDRLSRGLILAAEVLSSATKHDKYGEALDNRLRQLVVAVSASLPMVVLGAEKGDLQAQFDLFDEISSDLAEIQERLKKQGGPTATRVPSAELPRLWSTRYR